MTKDNWNERYSGSEYKYGIEPNEFLAAVADRIPAGRVLCLADGEGRNGVYLAGLGYDVTSVDQSEVGLAKAGQLAAERGVKIKPVVADLSDFKVERNHWSGIVSIFCHLPPELRQKVHHAVVAGLTEGGVFIIEAYTPRQLLFKTGGPPVAELMMTLENLREELRGLRLEVAREIDRDMREGSCHSGKGAVVQIVGIREKS
jgi:SAM-dependent methyltransferase